MGRWGILKSEVPSGWGLEMRLTVQLAQPIVDRAITILGRNVNLMDASGIICGSGDADRIGSYHEGAARVLQSGRPLSIDPTEAEQYAGARPGLNLPIRLEGRVVGVVGITGTPAEVRPFGELLREMVELLLAQARVAETERLAALAQAAVVRELLTGQGELSDHVAAEAMLLGITFDKPYRVVVCEPFDDLAEQVETAIRETGADPVLLGGPWDGRMVLVVGRTEGGIAAHLVGRLGQGIFAAEGLSLPGLPGLRRSYRTALAALEAGRRLLRSNAFCADDLYLETLMRGLSPQDAAGFVERVLGRLPAANTPRGRTARETIRAYLAAGMSRTRAAELLGIHRHTLIYRLDQSVEATGLDSRNWEDAMRLSLALLLERLFIQVVDSNE